MVTLIVLSIVGIGLLFVFSLCRISAEADRESESFGTPEIFIPIREKLGRQKVSGSARDRRRAARKAVL
jgi:hypothetical protein